MGTDNGKAKYYVLMEYIKDMIARGEIKPGEKLYSENELSQRCDVSRQTVRKAISILAGDGYLVTEHGKGTFVADRTRVKTVSKNIAVITTYIADYIFPAIIQGMDRVLTESGYSIILKHTGNSQAEEARCLREVIDKGIDGLIIEPSKSEIYCEHMELYKKLDELNIPYVFVQGIYESMRDKPYILMDDETGGYLAAKHLTDSGCRSVAGIFKIDDYQGKMRHKGYVKALNEAGIPYNPDLVILYNTEDRMIKPQSELENIIKSGHNLDAVVCYNDEIACRIINVIKEHGLSVPEDVKVTGYDNSFLAENSAVKLTTVDHPKEKLGEMAAAKLIKLINNGQTEDSTIVVPELIVRDSTK